ncbi:MAG TPA: 2-amino-4-hydroxy-6-hydroxymethyldihydropteridine diphosphokinase [Steroidobacteraceae bacterium]|jgi:2-amino-4-hydroxy-6-hydroxymethyldihydropteridine diphosphokinase|nr:2-amino-4-hydroxy-6-hydroxymethyldihydropteridine diphosphokinase [Steroidobacteraceae bacterium]
MTWFPVYVGIGSNLEQPIEQVRRALDALAGLPRTRLERRSSLYGSEPIGPAKQPPYVNAVAALLTQLPVRPLFDALRDLELRLGKRAPRERWGARTIDLDLLIYSSLRTQEPDLTLPHPGIVQRNFVLYPLREVAPELSVPGGGPVGMLASRVDSAGIWRLNDETTKHGA